MDFNSTEFVVFVLISLYFFRLFRQTVLGPWVFAVINAAFLIRHAASAGQLVPFAAFLFLSYGAHRVLCWRPGNGFKSVAFLGGIILLFGYLKQYAILSFLGPPKFTCLTLGLSFILFRVLQVLVDTQDGEIRERLSPLQFFNFTCSFLTLVSGPIQRCQDFLAQWKNVQSGVKLGNEVTWISRIITGYLKIVLWASIFHAAYDWATNLGAANATGPASLPMAVLCYALAAGTYLVFLYFNFSGYVDVVIGVAGFFGWQLPENFNHPFACANFLDLWSRWHITLSNWFKWYLYNPMLKSMVSRRPGPSLLPYWGVVAYFVTFFIMGVWHGTTWVFLVYGLCLGLGASLNKLYQYIARLRFGKETYAAWTANAFYRHCARGLALGYFTLALTCLWINPATMTWLLNSRFPVVGLAALIFLASLIALVSYLAEAGACLYASVLARKDETGTVPHPHWNVAWLGIRVLLLFAVLILNRNTAPDFVYKAF